MYLSKQLAFLLSALPSAFCVVGTRSAKRGLIFIPNSTYPVDNSIWADGQSDISWYYNYQAAPSIQLEQTKLEFVPMLWGAPDSLTDTTFLTTVQKLIKNGANISHVLSFNEPDGPMSTGGSNLDPILAATLWQRNIEPLKKLGVKLGAPAVTGAPSGHEWLQAFFTACAGKCSADFLPIHWYGNFEGLASHIGQVNASYPNMTMWVTEYAFDNQPLADTQNFFSSSLDYLDRLPYISRYSYFGSFRSSASNVGPNVAMLGSDGSLTDIGIKYLGLNGTGVIPSSSSAMGIAGDYNAALLLLTVLVGVAATLS